MSSKPALTTSTALSIAYKKYHEAQDGCPHWDYADDFSGASLQQCCESYQDAIFNLRAARKAYREAKLKGIC